MSTFTKEQLMNMEEVNLHALAQALEISNYSAKDRDELVYDILDQQAIITASEMSNKPKRGRKKKEVEKTTDDTETNTPAEVAEPNAEEVVAPKKKRGRPSKAEIAERNANNNTEPAQEVDTPATDDNTLDLQAVSSVVTDLDEIPDFIKEQITPQSEPQTEALTVEKEAPIEENTRLPEILQQANDNGLDFVIIKDIPEVYNESIFDDFRDIEDKPKFRKFSEDPLVNGNIEAGQTVGQERVEPEQPIVHEEPKDILLDGRGVLELMTHGTGFLRSSDYNYLTSPDDIYVDAATIRQYNLKQGDVVEGKVRAPKANEKHFILVELERINGRRPIDVRDRVAFEHLTPLFPDEKFNLCKGKGDNISLRIVDLFTPIGKGQRALIVAQPKTGKTILMKEIANAIAENHPDTYMMMLLIDERPEEVTDMARTVKAEVIASTFDEPASRHVKIANIVLEKAKRLVECGHDVVIFLDSITRLARAYNTVSPASGKVLSGGVDANALQKPKRFFGAARNIEGGGSLTIIATALIDTGSKMDEVIFEEFKGTGNMELQLDRNLANKRIFPAVNIVASSTRRDDLLQDETTLGRMWVLRNYISDMTPIEAMTDVKKHMEGTKNNEEYLLSMNS
ncbi:MAG: transcription termination factor Rho [Bacteroidaceae bacterium]|nr:transcription termination factor Rho [Bacteroidaceae bacterium]